MTILSGHLFILFKLVTIGNSFEIILDNCETPISMTRGWQNKQIGREFKTVLSGHLFILHRLVTIGSSFEIVYMGGNASSDI